MDKSKNGQFYHTGHMSTSLAKFRSTFVVWSFIFCVSINISSAGEYESAKEHENIFDPAIAGQEMVRKKEMISYNSDQWRPPKELLNTIPQKSAGIFWGSRKHQNVRINTVEKKFETRSLGLSGTFVRVGAAEPKLDGILVLPISRGKSNYLDRTRVCIFKWDEGSKQFEKMPRTGVSDDGNYVWARITEPGEYAVIGRTKDRRIEEVVQAICAAEELPSPGSRSIEDICREIACRGSRPDQGGPSLPGNITLDDLCNRCSQLEGLALPECLLQDSQPRHESCSEWRSLGPFNMAGVVTRIELDPRNPDKIYALADPGGLWVMDNVLDYPNKTWRPLTDDLDTVRLQTFALGDNGASTVIYLVDIFNRLFFSNNDGDDFEAIGNIANIPIGTERKVNRLLVRNDNCKSIYAATSYGLFQSDNGGTTWMLPPLKNGDIQDAVMDPDDASILYMAVGGVGIYKYSPQGGWEHIFRNDQLQPGDNFNLMLKIALGVKNANGTRQTDADRLVIVKACKPIDNTTAQGPLYAKRNGQSEWKQIGDNGPTPISKYVLAVSPHNSDMIIDGGIHLWHTSYNQGVQPPGSRKDRIVWNRSTGTHSDHLCVVFDPRPDHRHVVYASTDGGIYRSTNGGVTFADNPSERPTEQDFLSRKNLNKGLVTTPIFRAGVNGKIVLATIDHWHWWDSLNIASGIWRRAEGGGEWQPVYSSSKPGQAGLFYGFGSCNLYKVAYSNGTQINKTFSEFSPWTRVYTNSIVSALAIDPRLNSHTILAGAQFPPEDERCSYIFGSPGYQLMVTKEGDKAGGPGGMPRWESVLNTGGDPIAGIVFDPSKEGQAYAITRQGVVFKCKDVISDDLNAVPVFTEVGRWNLGNDCYPQATTSGVRQLATNRRGDLFAISQCRNRDLVHCNQLARSIDGNGGENWEVVGQSTLPHSIYHSLIVDPHDPYTLYLSTLKGVYISVDRGESWQLFDNGLPNVEIMQLLQDQDRIYAVTYGRGLWYIEPCSW